MLAFGRSYDTAEGSVTCLCKLSSKDLLRRARHLSSDIDGAHELVEHIVNAMHAWCIVKNGYATIWNAHAFMREPLPIDAPDSDVLLNAYAGSLVDLVNSPSNRLFIELKRHETPGDRLAHSFTVAMENGCDRPIVLGGGNSTSLAFLDKRELGLLLTDPEAFEFDSPGELTFCDRCGAYVGRFDDAGRSGRQCASCIENMHLVGCDFCGARYPQDDSFVVKTRVKLEDGSIEERYSCRSCMSQNTPHIDVHGHKMYLNWCSQHGVYELSNVDARHAIRHVEHLGDVCDEGVSECLAKGTLIKCDVCGSPIMNGTDRRRRDASGDGDISVCHACNAGISDYESVRDDDGSPHPHYFKPQPVFVDSDCSRSYVASEGALYLGVELEYDDDDETANADAVAKDIEASCDENVYCKREGSLRNGFECVTHPIESGYAVTGFDWGGILDKVNGAGFRATSKCGFHVHVNKSFFGEVGTLDREIGDARLAFLFDQHYDDFLLLTDRDKKEAMRWAAKSDMRLTEEDERDLPAIIDAKKASLDRCFVVNHMGGTTDEVRLWASTTDVECVRNVLDVTQALVRIAKELSVTAISEFDRDALGCAIVSRAIRPANVEAFLKRRWR